MYQLAQAHKLAAPLRYRPDAVFICAELHTQLIQFSSLYRGRKRRMTCHHLLMRSPMGHLLAISRNPAWFLLSMIAADDGIIDISCRLL